MNVRSAEFERNPYPFYRTLRERGGIHFLEEESAWLVVSYDLASAILRQPKPYSSSPFAVLSPSLHGADPPDHTVMRRTLGPYFTPERQHSQRASIERHARRIISRLETLESFDAVQDLAIPIPFSVACEWMGLDEDVAARLHSVPVPQLTWEQVKPGLKQTGVLADLMRDSVVTEKQLTEFAGFFLAASYGSSRDFLILALSLLIAHREVVDAVLTDMSLVPTLIEEMLRLEPSAHTVIRRTTADVELEGKLIPRESMIWISLGAANRDPAVFESPDELRLDREMTRHLAFGIGPHFCLGSPMARLESEIVLTHLMPLITRLRALAPMKTSFWADFPGGVPSSRQVESWQLRFVRE
jgi:cytochrome P450